MKTLVILIFPGFLMAMISITVTAHPGSGIVIDKFGQVYFTDTGKGVWKLDSQGKLTYMPSSRFHWMAIDPMGNFAASQKSFGGYFERVTPEGSKPALIQCSDFNVVVNIDGNIYYADTRPASAKIVRRTPEGKESVLVNNKILEFVNGMTTGPDGSIYISESSNPDSNTIRKITMNGTMSVIGTFIGKSSNDLPLETVPSYCRGLAIDSSGIIYVAATGSRSVIKITPQGKITTILSETSPWTPTGVAVFRGEVFVLEWHDVTQDNLEVREAYIPRIRKIGIDGKATTLATVPR